MKTFFKMTLLIGITILFLGGCAQKINVESLNKEIISTNFISKTLNTYDEKEAKITTYYFKNKNGEVYASNEITYIPMDATGQLYSPFSRVTMTINRLTNNQAQTIEEALVMEVKKQNFIKLYTDKEEYIIGNDFARDLKWSIREFNEMIDRQDDRDESRIPIS